MSISITQFTQLVKAPLVQAFYRIDLPGMSRESLLVQSINFPRLEAEMRSVFILGKEYQIPIALKDTGDIIFEIPEDIFGTAHHHALVNLLETLTPVNNTFTTKQENVVDKFLTIYLTPVNLTLSEVAAYYVAMLTKGWLTVGKKEVAYAGNVLKNVLKYTGVKDKTFNKIGDIAKTASTYVEDFLIPVSVTVEGWMTAIDEIQLDASNVDSVRIRCTFHYNSIVNIK